MGTRACLPSFFLFFWEECQVGKHVDQHVSDDSIIVVAVGLGLALAILGSIAIIRARKPSRGVADSR